MPSPNVSLDSAINFCSKHCILYQLLSAKVFPLCLAPSQAPDLGSKSHQSFQEAEGPSVPESGWRRFLFPLEQRGSGRGHISTRRQAHTGFFNRLLVQMCIIRMTTYSIISFYRERATNSICNGGPHLEWFGENEYQQAGGIQRLKKVFNLCRPLCCKLQNDAVTLKATCNQVFLIVDTFILCLKKGNFHQLLNLAENCC